MPNHVTNRITGPGVTAKLTNKDGHVDFNRIIPTPECVPTGSTNGSVERVAKIALGLFDFSQAVDQNDILKSLQLGNATQQLLHGSMLGDMCDEDFAKAVAMMKSYRECGYLDWYGWNIANWGTKWNAYDTGIVSPNIVEFQTAWSAPTKVITALKAPLKHEWADEDTGSNVGYAVYAGNGRQDIMNLDGTKEGYELAFELCGGGDEYEWNGETYVYIDDE